VSICIGPQPESVTKQKLELLIFLHVAYFFWCRTNL